MPPRLPNDKDVGLRATPRQSTEEDASPHNLRGHAPALLFLHPPFTTLDLSYIADGLAPRVQNELRDYVERRSSARGLRYESACDAMANALTAWGRPPGSIMSIP